MDPTQLSDAQLDAAIAQAQQQPAPQPQAPAAPAQGDGSVVFGGGASVSGQSVTAPQQAYAQSAQADTSAPAGSSTNPYYDHGSAQGPANFAHVTPDGQLSVPADQPGGSINLGQMSNADLDAAIATERAKASPLLDMAAQAPVGMAQGLAGLVGLPGDFLDGAGVLGNLAGKGVAALAGKPYVAPKSSPREILPGITLPDSQDINGLLQKMGGRYPDAQTLPGQYTRTIASFAPAALTPGGLLTKAASVVLPGAASEAAGRATKGTDLEPWARLAGGLLGGGVVGAGAAMLKSPEQVIASAARGATPDVLDRADQLMAAGRATGQPLTRAEAINSASGGATSLNRMVRSVESVRRGKDTLAPFYAARPDQVRSAVTGLADTIAPPASAPGMVGQAAQDAAVTGLNRARQTVNAAAKPYYDALAGQEMDPDQFADLAANPSYQQAMAGIRGNPVLNAPIKDLPDHNLAVVNEAVKHLDTMGTQAAGTPMAPGNNYLASLHGDARSLASDLASDASDAGGPEGQGPWSQARSTVAQLSRQSVDPLKAGPLGTVSSTPDLSSQLAALFPASPVEGAAAETGQAARVLNATDPSVLPQLARSHIMDTFNAASKRLQNGLPNANSGPNFAKAIGGNAEQESALLAGLSALPNRADASSGLQRLLDVHRAMGTKLAEGSPTAEKLADAAAMKTTPLGGLLKTNLVEPGEGIAHLLESVAAKRQVDSLSKWLLDQGSVKGTPTAPTAAMPWAVALPASQQMRLLADRAGK